MSVLSKEPDHDRSLQASEHTLRARGLLGDSYRELGQELCSWAPSGPVGLLPKVRKGQAQGPFPAPTVKAGG